MITLERAMADGITSQSLLDVAAWNDAETHRGPGAKRRRNREQAEHLRAIAKQVAGVSGHRAAYKEAA